MTTVTRQDLANALRILAVDAVQRARSGHPGMPMGMAELSEALFRHRLRHNPVNPAWPNRDRFVLSNGHGSMLLYGVLHLSGYDLSIDDLMAFRQLESRTPGHPEIGVTPGVETTTGPLGQGLANAVGMALAERLMASTFNRPGFPLVDHRTYVFVGDGCLMEGISHEACSLAGTLGLGKLVVIYDANGISIDGPIDRWFTDDTPARFRAYGWRVLELPDGHDFEAIDATLHLASVDEGRPTLIVARTVIGKGSPNKEGKESSHGAPLGEAEVALVRDRLGWVHDAFEIPTDIRAAWDAREVGARLESSWRELLDAYSGAHPELAVEFQRRVQGRLPETWPDVKAELLDDARLRTTPVATRKASQRVLELLGPNLPELFGGSADLTHSNLTTWTGSKVLERVNRPDRVDRADRVGPVAHVDLGNYLHFGVREFAMSAIANGLALHAGVIPYVGTFLVFSDYARNALRMAALMRQRVVFVFSHDSIGLGEDGPTHQPVEHAASLRLIPNLDVWRPCDAVETAVAWASALERRDGPSALLLSRQDLPHVPRAAPGSAAPSSPSGGAEASPSGADPKDRNHDEAGYGAFAGIARGGYVLEDSDRSRPDVVLIATGSEVRLALEARVLLRADGLQARVVSMPSTTRFDRADALWRASVLPPGVPRLAVEAGVGDLWRKYVGLDGAVVSLDTFGASAPDAALFKHFGFTPEHVARAARSIVP